MLQDKPSPLTDVERKKYRDAILELMESPAWNTYRELELKYYAELLYQLSHVKLDANFPVHGAAAQGRTSGFMDFILTWREALLQKEPKNDRPKHSTAIHH